MPPCPEVSTESFRLGARANAEKAQIAVVGDESHRKLRIENEFTDEHGADVKLKKGARVKVTVTASILGAEVDRDGQSP